jgi:hypothetical protein
VYSTLMYLLVYLSSLYPHQYITPILTTPITVRTALLNIHRAKGTKREETLKRQKCWYYVTIIQSGARRVCHRFPPFPTLLSLWAMDLEELETLLRKPTHTEEEYARITGLCSLTRVSVEDLSHF